MKNNPRAVYKGTPVVNSYRELLEMAQNKYADNVAYRYKRDYTKKEPEFLQKTYGETVTDVKAVATKFLDLGLEGETVIIIGKNRYEWCVSYFAVTTSNAVIAPLDVALPDNEIEALVNRSKASTMLFDKKFAELAKRIKANNEKLNTLICLQDISDLEIMNFNDILSDGKKLIDNGNCFYDNVKVDPEKMSIMLFTSGTTNLPKIVMLSQKNICSNINALSQFVRLYESDTLLSFLPIHHTFESTITFLYGFYSGSTVAFSDGLRYIAQNLKEYKVSVFVAVPLVLETMYKKILHGIEEQGKTGLINTVSKVSNFLLKFHIDLRKKLFKQVLDNFGGNLRIVLYGAAPMNKATIIGYNNLGIDLIQGYGLTETSPVISAETDKEKRPGSVGLVLDNLEVKIDNPNSEGIGEIIVKGPSVMLGYYENDEQTSKALRDGWFYTGDFGYLDDDGFLFITGRKKDVIVLQNGKNVYPQEIELLINKFVGVKESLVYQRHKDDRDTMLCAKIVYDEDIMKQTYGDKSPDEFHDIVWEQVKELNSKLPIYKRIKNISLSTKELSKTTTHKVKRYEELANVD